MWLRSFPCVEHLLGDVEPVAVELLTTNELVSLLAKFLDLSLVDHPDDFGGLDTAIIDLVQIATHELAAVVQSPAQFGPVVVLGLHSLHELCGILPVLSHRCLL